MSFLFIFSPLLPGSDVEVLPSKVAVRSFIFSSLYSSTVMSGVAIKRPFIVFDIEAGDNTVKPVGTLQLLWFYDVLHTLLVING